MGRFTNVNMKTILWVVGGLLVFWFLMVNVPDLFPNLINAMTGCTKGVLEIDIPANP